MVHSAPASISLLGATGSIGTSTLDVVRQHADRFSIHSAAISSNWKALLPAIQEFDIKRVCVWDPASAKELQKNTSIEVLVGMEGLLELACDDQVEYVVNGLVGAIGCEPTLKAIQASKKIGLANKETMVMAGDIINRSLKEYPKSELIPIDSEHSAIFQCLGGRPNSEVESLLLTASGGPFRTLPKEKFQAITKAEALDHPTWDMGPKITIDSATMMNKGLEVIEAHYLFNIPFDRIQIVVHPTSIVHSFVQFQDGSLMAQLGSPDMKLPILYSLTYPERLALNIERINMARLQKLEFFDPDPDKFPCIALAYQAGNMGGSAPAILNAVNEVAVDLFLQEKICFMDIPETIHKVLETATPVEQPTIDDVLLADKWAREKAYAILT
jgi:1-deoxy-D-xylulose-5-phosphate reductoisomerase